MADTKISALTAVATAVPGTDEFAVNQGAVSKKVTLSQYAGVVGGFAALDSGLLVPRSYLPQIAGLLHNMGAATAPGVGDDSGDGYGVGSRWLDTTADREYVALDVTVGAAVWKETTLPTTAYAQQSADVTLTVADTMTDVTGASITLAAGTWDISAIVSFQAVSASYAVGGIATGAGTLVAAGRTQVPLNEFQTVPLMVRVTPAISTTYKLRGQMSGTTNKVVRFPVGGTYIGTLIRAVQVA